MSDEEKAEGELKDLFCRGVITKLFPTNSMGLVRTGSGREVPFSFSSVILLGDIKSASELKENQEVGYDLDWTSEGLKITKIKVYTRRDSSEIPSTTPKVES